MQNREDTSPDRVVLSSSQTWFLKFVAWWLLPSGAAAFAVLVGPPSSPLLRLLLFAGLLAGAVVFGRTGSRLHKVTATAQGVEVSDYRTTVDVPYATIGEVISPRPGWPAELWLKRSTALGSVIRFVPGPFGLTLDEPPAVLLVRERAERARRAAAGGL